MTEQASDGSFPAAPAAGEAERSQDRANRARATMEALATSPDVFEVFFDQARIGLALADLSTCYVRVNATYAELLGRRPEDLIGVPFSDVLDVTAGSSGHSGTPLPRSGDSWPPTEERYVAPDGGSRWVLHGVTVVPGPTGAPAWFAVSAQDISERRRVEEELRALSEQLAERAVRDPLTGLANRALLEERLRAALARDGRSGASTAVLFLDLDGFKAVNDRHGHAVGDLVLRTLAGRLSALIRPSDTVARIGGDEFVVLVEGAVQDGLAPLISRLHEAVRQPVPVGDVQVAVGVSIGLAVWVAGEADPISLLGEADSRMYAAKRLGR